MTPFPDRRNGYVLTAGAIALVLASLGFVVDRPAFFACWLTAWWACAGAVLGSQANLWLHDLTGGAWGRPLRPVWRHASAAMPLLLVLMLPLIAATWAFYPWSDASWAPASDHPGFQARWLSPGFVTIRLLAYAVLWQTLTLLSLRRAPARRRNKGLPVLGLMLYVPTVSLASIDLVASLMPQWYSSGFGLIAIAMQMKLGFALGVACAARRPLPAQLGRDWGNLLLMYVMMWAYIAFTQFLIIWAENLPSEIAWYVPRLQSDWRWLGVALVMLGFFLPLMLLLLRAVKQHYRRLRAIAIALCGIGWLESIWLILPSVDNLAWHATWMAPLASAGMAALLWTAARPRRHVTATNHDMDGMHRPVHES